MTDKFLDKEGLQIVANNTNLRVKIVTEIPSTPRNNMVILYDGTDTADFIKGGIYKYNGTEWESLSGSAEQIYDATSENAQSGKAVEQAVEEFITNNTTLVWEEKTWTGDFQPEYGYMMWTDGINSYYSNGLEQYVLNKATDTWEEKTWYGTTNLSGQGIWKDGDNIYYSLGFQYVLNKSTSTWETKTWYGELSDIRCYYIWKDGDNIYYSDDSNQYILNKATDTWEEKTWYGLTNFDGQYIWTDGDNVYYSDDSNQYILNKATDTWESKTWYGLEDLSETLNGSNIWTDGNSIYWTAPYYNYVLNKETSTWNYLDWGENISGYSIWTDNKYFYCNDSDIGSYVCHRKFNTSIK